MTWGLWSLYNVGELRKMRTLDGGFAFTLWSVGAEGGALLVPRDGVPVIAAEQRWSGPRATAGSILWTRAASGDRELMMAGPAVGLGVGNGALEGVLCLALDRARPTTAVPIEDLRALTRMLVLGAAAPPALLQVAADDVRRAHDPAERMRRTIEQCDGCVVRMARHLQVDRKTVYSWLDRYQLRDFARACRDQRDRRP